MEEVRKSQHIVLKKQDESTVEGSVEDFAFDRVLVLVEPRYVETAKKFQELDETIACLDTHMGQKRMISAVISPINSENKLTIENNPTIIKDSNREFVRVNSNLKFAVWLGKTYYICALKDISIGGIAFRCGDYDFKVGEKIVVELYFNDTKAKVKTAAKILNKRGNAFAAQFDKLSMFDQNKISKYVFSVMHKNGKWS